MANTTSWIFHVEAFVDESRPSNEKLASVEAISALVKKDVLTVEALVREMEAYLTTSDHLIRARGITLLAEILSRLHSKPLDSSIINSLVDFFTSRLADWQALHGALIGCLALLRRKRTFGTVAGSDAKALALSFFTNVQVQSLAVHDRKLCFEVLQCLLDVYSDNVVTLGDKLVYAICDAIDEEKDPQCLFLTFHLVETLVRLFPDPNGSVADVADDLFDILGRYFPVYFTHPKTDELNIKRDELARALMRAFCSTPFFEPFAVPLILEKLSSSLPLAKLDSLMYLNNCILQYGAGRMKKHAKLIWSALKDVIFTCFKHSCLFSSTSKCSSDTESEDDQIAKEALTCLKTAILGLNDVDDFSLLNLIVEDFDIMKAFNSLSSESCYSVTSEDSKNQLCVLGSILSAASIVSRCCCNRVFEKFFTPLMDILGISSSDQSLFLRSQPLSRPVNSSAVYLCVELLASCRDLILSDQGLLQKFKPAQNSWFCLLKNYANQLAYVLGSIVVMTDNSTATDADNRQQVVGYAVKGLQVLSTFPECHSPIAEDIYRDILVILVQIITDSHSGMFVWRLSLKALVQIGLFIEKNGDSQKAEGFNKFVVQRIVSVLSLDDSSIPLAQKLEAASEIGMAKLDFMLAVTHGLEEAISVKLFDACINGELRSAEILISMLNCYSCRMLPWWYKTGSFEEISVPFAISIWKQIGDVDAFNVNFHKLGVHDAVMMTMKLLVSGCSQENQALIVQKGYNILLSSTQILFLKELVSFSTSNFGESEFASDSISLSCKDVFLVSLFWSALIALHPQATIPDLKLILKLLMVFLLKGYASAAQALGSILNKWSEKLIGSSLGEAIELIFQMDLSIVLNSCPYRKCSDLISNEGDFSLYTAHENSSFIIHAVDGLAWIGKGLLMRGHEKVKEIAMFFLKCLLINPDQKTTATHLNDSADLHGKDEYSTIARCAADAFHVLLSDSDLCLSKNFHATIKPLYKQRFFTSMMMVLQSAIKESNLVCKRISLYRAFGHIISDTPLSAVISQANMVLHPLLEALDLLSSDALNKDLIYSLLLVLSGVLMDDSGKEAVMNNIYSIVSHLIRLISYPHMMAVRETAIQCLVAMSGLPHARIYPMRPQVLHAVTNALDDPKRIVRQEAVRCRQAWASIATRSLHF